MNNRHIKKRLYAKLLSFVTFEIDWRGHAGKARLGYVFCDPDLTVKESRPAMRRTTTKRLARLLRCSNRQVKRCLRQLSDERKIGKRKVTWGIKIAVIGSNKWVGTDREFYFDSSQGILMPANQQAYDRHIRVVNNPPKRRWGLRRSRRRAA
jgi:hypothetical protein